MPAASFRLLSALLAGLAATPLGLSTAQAQAPYSEYSCPELWYARNSIYQMKGYCFKTERAITEFGRNCFTPFGKLTKSEAKQVAEIKRWEDRRGCNGY
jgi:YARHG domain